MSRIAANRLVRGTIGLFAMGALSAGAGCAGSREPMTYAWPVEEHVFEHAAVAADHPVASQAGLEMLKKGGNAVDAAVATSFCLSVVRPYSCGLGRGGFMVIHDPGTDDAVVINYRETAPAAVGPRHYVKLDDPLASRYGHHAAGVPGTVAGLLYALEHYGTLDRRAVLAPAIRAAEDGVPADANYVAACKDVAKKLDEHPRLRSLAETVWRDRCREGSLKVGDIVRNPDQARALRLIARHGADAFYRGEIADAIVRTMREHGGTIARDDLAGYEVDVITPLRRRFRDYEILAMPPPSSGGIAILQMFGMVEFRYDQIRQLPVNSPAYVHFIAETMKHAFADRAEWLADPAFVDVPVSRLLDEDYLERLAWSISRTWTMKPQNYGSRRPPPDDAGTSHLSVVDENGMAVACTETINLGYGSLVTVPGFGFCLNNEMDDFTTVPGEPNAFGLTQSERNAPEPGKRPLSSMSPTIVVQGGRAVLVGGASGGPRIITGTFQCLVDCMLYGETAAQAVARPRFHHQWLPDALRIEVEWIDQHGLAPTLQAMGHEVEVIDAVGNVQLIQVRDGLIRAASDPRKGGRPAGY